MTSEQKERDAFEPIGLEVTENNLWIGTLKKTPFGAKCDDIWFSMDFDKTLTEEARQRRLARAALIIESVNASRAHQARPEGELVERVARAINPTAFESYEQHIEYRIKEGGTREEGVVFAEWCDNGAHPLNRVSAAIEMAKAALTVFPPQSDACRKCDDEMLRVKMCEHIAEGEEGWNRPECRNVCPSTAAVASLRDKYEDLLSKQPDAKPIDRSGEVKTIARAIYMAHPSSKAVPWELLVEAGKKEPNYQRIVDQAITEAKAAIAAMVPAVPMLGEDEAVEIMAVAYAEAVWGLPNDTDIYCTKRGDKLSDGYAENIRAAYRALLARMKQGV